MKKLLAELLGTFALSLAVGLSLTGALHVATPVIAALTLGLFVYTVGHISGAHLNPAVTIGVWSVRKIGLRDAVSYIIAQLVGAYIALLVVSTIIPDFAIASPMGMPAFWGEILGSFFFIFGVAAVVHNKVAPNLSGAVIGFSLFLGISLASALSGGVLNPAVALGTGTFSLPYILGPLVGGVLAMGAFRFLSSSHEATTHTKSLQ